jgi:hypothetical protein
MRKKKIATSATAPYRKIQTRNFHTNITMQRILIGLGGFIRRLYLDCISIQSCWSWAGANNRSWSSKDSASMGGGASMNGGGGSSTLLNDSPSVPKTGRKIATEKLHVLYQNLHYNESLETLEPYLSGTFLHAIQDVSSIFEGNQKQDAHEFLMCILDTARDI